MPELPDLTVFAESLQKLALNRTIVEAAYHRSKRLNVPPQLFRETLLHRRLTAIERVGKELLFTLDDDNRFTVNLVLSGGFAFGKKGEVGRSPIATIEFDAGDTLAVIDPQLLTKIDLNPDLTGRPPDALEVTASYLEKKCREKPRTLVKALLIDQKIMGGIGNAYSDEILWQARISPRSLTGKLPGEAVERLAEAIRSVLTFAITYLRQHHPGILSGEVRDFLSVHNRSAKKSPGGSPIIVEQIASKRTYYTEEQKLYG